MIRKVLGIDPKNVIHRACVYNVGLHNDNVPKHLAGGRRHYRGGESEIEGGADSGAERGWRVRRRGDGE